MKQYVESYVEETKTIPTDCYEKKANCKTKDLYILLVFSLSTISLLMAISIYCYLIKYQAKQKLLLRFNVTNNELKEIMY